MIRCRFKQRRIILSSILFPVNNDSSLWLVASSTSQKEQHLTIAATQNSPQSTPLNLSTVLPVPRKFASSTTWTRLQPLVSSNSGPAFGLCDRGEHIRETILNGGVGRWCMSVEAVGNDGRRCSFEVDKNQHQTDSRQEACRPRLQVSATSTQNG